MSRPTPQTPAVGSRDVEFIDPRHSRQPGPRERVDAARNRARVLEAADAMFRRSDPDAVTMGDIARAAGVGRATLYRRYPDVRSIAVALLDQHEYDLQE
ncbi:MAG: TetR/AcrR family transcriptional regulator, partial [Nocardioidaceae bacterium]